MLIIQLLTNINNYIRHKVTKPATLSIILYLLFALAALAKPNCFLLDGNERLTNHCLLETLKGKAVDEQTMLFVVSRLKPEGYFGGLDKTKFSSQFHPDIYYSSNINGGNPEKPLVLGDLKFESDPTLLAKEGVLIGFNSGFSARKTFGEGDYIDASVSLNYAYSPIHEMSISTAGTNICSKNRIQNNIYADICARVSEVSKEITNDQTSSLAASISKLDLFSGSGFNEVTASVVRLLTNDYAQNQIHLTVDTLQSDGLAAAFELKYGNSVHNQLALKYGFGITASSIIVDRKLNFNIGHEIYGGGKLFGINRSDISTIASVSMNFDKATKITIGYLNRDSSIDFFDENYPIIRLTRTFVLN